jgi:Icc-related predicted phosphoesterase
MAKRIRTDESSGDGLVTNTKKLKATSSSSTTTVNFFIISDTHELELRSKGPFRLNAPQEKIDVVLHCGDLTENGSVEGYQKALQLLGGIEAELKLVIAGNHEISLDKTYFLEEGGTQEIHEKALELMTGQLAHDMKVTYLPEGTHEFKLANGSKFSVYASPYTPRDSLLSRSAFQYNTSDDRFSSSTAPRPDWATSTTGTDPSIIPADVDIVMTHGPPRYMLDETFDKRSAGCEHLWRAIVASKPLLHCFGHIHSGWGAQRVAWRSGHTAEELESLELTPGGDEWIRIRDFSSRGKALRQGFAEISGCVDDIVHRRQTLFVNAAIDPVELEPKNPPWLVKLNLATE